MKRWWSVSLVVHRYTIWIDRRLKTVSWYLTAYRLITKIFQMLHRQCHHKHLFQILGISPTQEFSIVTPQALRNSLNLLPSVPERNQIKVRSSMKIYLSAKRAKTCIIVHGHLFCKWKTRMALNVQNSFYPKFRERWILKKIKEKALS